MGETRYLDLIDLFLIAEAVLGVSAEELGRLPRLSLAESALAAPAAEFGGVEFYPDPIVKAAILCSRLVKNHPFPDGNKRTGFLAMLEFLDRNGLRWRRSDADPNETVNIVEGIAAGTISEEHLADWLRGRVQTT